MAKKDDNIVDLKDKKGKAKQTIIIPTLKVFEEFVKGIKVSAKVQSESSMKVAQAYQTAKNAKLHGGALKYCLKLQKMSPEAREVELRHFDIYRDYADLDSDQPDLYDDFLDNEIKAVKKGGLI